MALASAPGESLLHLVWLGLQADHTNKEGNTPLHFACQYCPPGKTLSIVKLLQWSEASILMTNRAGDTPFSLAIRFNKKGNEYQFPAILN